MQINFCGAGFLLRVLGCCARSLAPARDLFPSSLLIWFLVWFRACPANPLELLLSGFALLGWSPRVRCTGTALNPLGVGFRPKNLGSVFWVAAPSHNARAHSRACTYMLVRSARVCVLPRVHARMYACACVCKCARVCVALGCVSTYEQGRLGMGKKKAGVIAGPGVVRHKPTISKR